MDYELLKKHLVAYRNLLKKEPSEMISDRKQREERVAFYQSWTVEKLKTLSEEDLFEYIAPLWAMLIWGNKRYVVDRLIAENGLDKLRAQLANLVWGTQPVRERWDRFRKNIKGMGPAMMSEILCHVHPDTCMLWNRRAAIGLEALGVKNLPRYDYQITGKRYEELSAVARVIGDEMKAIGFEETNLLAVDYFIWSELQVKESLSDTNPSVETDPADQPIAKAEEQQFVHNDVRDKLAEIGEWLGFDGRTEIKVADGSKVDTVWESTIGNMGRVIYVFEVQTKGSIDSLILNLLKSLNNPAVQGVVAVSDSAQIETIKKHASAVKGLSEKLKYWDYVEVLDIHEKLKVINESINRLNLVPEGF